MNKEIKASILTLGCRVNQYESDAIMQELAKLYPEKEVMANADQGRFRMFDLVSGTNFIREKFSETKQYKDIEAHWNKDVESFKKLSKKYYLYK